MAERHLAVLRQAQSVEEGAIGGEVQDVQSTPAERKNSQVKDGTWFEFRDELSLENHQNLKMDTQSRIK